MQTVRLLSRPFGLWRIEFVVPRVPMASCFDQNNLYMFIATYLYLGVVRF